EGEGRGEGELSAQPTTHFSRAPSMNDLTRAVEIYNGLLDDELGQSSQSQLNAQLHRRELFFGERPLCTVLRPRFLTPGQYDTLRYAIAGVMPAFRKVQA